MTGEQRAINRVRRGIKAQADIKVKETCRKAFVNG